MKNKNWEISQQDDMLRGYDMVIKLSNLISETVYLQFVISQ